MRSGTMVIAAALLLPGLVRAQVTSLKGRFMDPVSHAAVAGVQVRLTNLADTTDSRQAIASDVGAFEITGLGVHDYRLEASRLGYMKLSFVIPVRTNGQDAGVLQMVPEAVNVPGVTVTESPAPAIQVADTTEFRASAVKTAKDANAEDLVQKLPGITVENGQLKAQGENVQQVLVNGRPFFGTDPTAALRNLPAEVVDRIQVYDKASDQAEFSGFEDGRQQRTLNFILKKNRNNFGKLTGGYGDRDRYVLSANPSWVLGTSQLTLLAHSNNINQRNSSQQDLLGALSPNSGGSADGGSDKGDKGSSKQLKKLSSGFDPGALLQNQQGGISTTSSGGFNFVGQWGPTLQINSSLLLNGTDTENSQLVAREYVPPQDSIASYAQDGTTSNRDLNDRFDGRFQWMPDSSNLVTIKPRIYFQRSRSVAQGLAANAALLGSIINSSLSDLNSHATGGTSSNEITLQHRFAKPGRNASAEVELTHSDQYGARTQRSLNRLVLADTSAADTVDQRMVLNNVTNSVFPRFAYTDAFMQGWQFQLRYDPELTRTYADARVLGLGPTGGYTELDAPQSDRFVSRNLIQKGGVATLVTKGAWRWQTNASWQRATLESQQWFPNEHLVNQVYNDFLPAMRLMGTFHSQLNMKLAWATSTTSPSITELQNVVDRSNPLLLKSGNPDLRPSYSHHFSLRLSDADPLKSTSKFMFLSLVHVARPISNATFTAPRDTTMDGIALLRGTQLTRPTNLDAAWNAYAFAGYSRPLKLLQSIFTVNGGASYSQTPTQLNAATLVNRSYVLRYGAVLASNVSENLDFTLTYQGNYNMIRDSPGTAGARDYYSHTIGLRLSAVDKHGIIVREEVSHNLQGGASSRLGQDVMLWNASLGKKFLKDGAGELRVTASDVLQQDRGIRRSVTESYVQDTRDQSLGRFVQALFTYTIK